MVPGPICATLYTLTIYNISFPGNGSGRSAEFRTSDPGSIPLTPGECRTAPRISRCLQQVR